MPQGRPEDCFSVATMSPLTSPAVTFYQPRSGRVTRDRSKFAKMQVTCELRPSLNSYYITSRPLLIWDCGMHSVNVTEEAPAHQLIQALCGAFTVETDRTAYVTESQRQHHSETT